MSNRFSDELESFHKEYLSIVSDYKQNVLGAFLDGDDLSGEELHRGKHFLAHGIAGQFAAKQDTLIEHLTENNKPIAETLRTLHDRSVTSIQSIHDAVNALFQSGHANGEPPENPPEVIIEHLHQLDALLETTFKIEENLVEKGVFDDIGDDDLENLKEQLGKATEQNQGCSSHGRHSMG